MARTVPIEEFPPDTQQILADAFAEGEPVILLREGQPVAEFTPYGVEDDIDVELTSEEKEELREIVLQSRAEIAAGQYMTREEFLVRNAHKLQSGKK